MTYVLENTKVRATFADDGTYGIVLQSIENLADTSAISFVATSPFRVVLRNVAASDTFTTLESNGATAHTVEGLGYDLDHFHLGAGVESPALGSRKYFQATFTFDNISAGTDDLRLMFTASLLDDQPDRILFALYLDPSYGNGLAGKGVFWAAPILLAMTPFASEHYMIPVNGGLATRAPQTDLVGNGTTYRFKTAVGFEPETKVVAAADRMEVFYPQSSSTALAAYGDRSASAATVYVHDSLQFKPRRMLDTFSGGAIRLEHEGLVENGIAAGNGWTISNTDDLRCIQSYARVFKRTGDFIGEDVALDYQKWATTSVQGLAMLPAKVVDRPDMETFRDLPLFVATYDEDDENQNGKSEEIVKELRMAFSGLSTTLPWMAPGITELLGDTIESMNGFRFNETSGTHPGLVGDSVPDLFDVVVDDPKITKSTALKALDVLRGGYVAVRRPTPYDGRGIWETDGMDLMRVKNHLEAVDPGYKTTDQWMRQTRTVASTSFNGTFTKITLNGGALDPTLWNIFSFYQATTATIDHNAHREHLGWLKRTNNAYAFPIERQTQADFIANPPVIYVAGNRTANVLVGHTLQLNFMGLQFIPGYDVGGDGQVGNNATTSLCSMADEYGADVTTPTFGFGIRFINQAASFFRTWGYMFGNKFSNLSPVCWATHNGETPGSNQQILAWRRIAALIRSVFPKPFQLFEEKGPFDWLTGLVDGQEKTQVRKDLTTSIGSWGASPFFQTAWGQYHRGGIFSNHGAMHVSNIDNQFNAYATFWEGAGSKSVFREMLVSDYFLGKVPGYTAAPDPAERMGTRPDGAMAFTPFYNASFPMTQAQSYAALLARLIQFHLNFDSINVRGQRQRSFHRTGSATITSKLNALTILDGHDLPATELGNLRAPLFHSVMFDDSGTPRLIALFVNDQQTTVTDTYAFTPSWYPSMFPLSTGSYSASQFVVNYDGIAATTLGLSLSTGALSITLGPGEVQAIVIQASTPGSPAGGPCSNSGESGPNADFDLGSGLSGTAGSPAGSACSASGLS